MNLTHISGQVAADESLYVVDDADNRVAWSDVWTVGDTASPGKPVHIDGRGSDCALVDPTKGTTYRFVWTGGGTEQAINSYTVPTAPENPPASHIC